MNVRGKKGFAVKQNNTGVHFYATMGDYCAALHYFRQALATKVAIEHRAASMDHLLDPMEDSRSASTRSIKQCVTPEPSLPDMAVDDTPSISHTYHEASMNTKQKILQESRCASTTVHFQKTEDTEVKSEYEPYLYLNPILMDDSDVSTYSKSSTAPDMMSVIIMLNLGIVYQTMDRSSVKAISFYEIARVLLLSQSNDRTSSRTSSFVQVVLLNNSAIWCYEQQDFGSMIAYLDELKNLLCNSSNMKTLDVIVAHGVQRNISELSVGMKRLY